MSLLTELWILIKTNAGEVQQGAAHAKRATKDLEASLTTTEAASHKLGESFGDVARRLGEAAVAFISLDKIYEGFKSAEEYAESFYTLSSVVEENVKDLDLWGRVVQRNGGTVQGFQSSIKALYANIAQFTTYGGGSLPSIFKAQLRLDLDDEGKVKKPLQLLKDLASVFSKLPKQQAFTIGKQLGLDEGLILLLEKGNKELERQLALQAQLGALTGQDTATAHEFADAWADTTTVFRSFFIQMNQLLLPALTVFLNGVIKVMEYLIRHPSIARGVFAAMASLIIAATVAMTVVFWEAIVPILILTGAFIALSALATVLGDVIDDSSDTFKRWGMEGVKVLKDLQKETEEYLKKHPRLNSALETFGAASLRILRAILNAWNLLAHPINFIIGETIKGLHEIEKAYEKISGLFKGKNNQHTIAMINAGKDAIANTAHNPIVTEANNSINNRVQHSTRNISVKTGPTTIQTQATDGQSILGAFSRNLESEIVRASGHFDDGLWI